MHVLHSGMYGKLTYAFVKREYTNCICMLGTIQGNHVVTNVNINTKHSNTGYVCYSVIYCKWPPTHLQNICAL